ncbi:GNAT family N-acetyltransferase [Streptomyces sp. NPDC002701]|uniref:GNAT family N-acetyltransferase n=1 Tax=Streptomyces sp. NPDC002701 TaxID=3364661 RepID=UPI00368D876B
MAHDLPDPAIPCRIHSRLGADALDVLTRHWPALYAQDLQATPFQSPKWLASTIRLLPPTATPLILAATTAGGRIVAALALARHRDRSRIRFRPLSAPDTGHLHLVGPHAEDEAIARALALHLLLWQEAGADVTLPGLRADTALGSAVRAICHDSLTTDGPASSVVALPFDFGALAPSRQREHARRCRHWTHLAAGHTITYRRSHHQQGLLSGLDVLASLHASAQHHHAGPTCASEWRDAVPAIGAKVAFVADLHVDDTPVAAQLCLTRGRRCYSVQQVAHPAYRHLAPAHALLRHLLDDLAQEGFHTLDPGHGTSPGASAAPKASIRLAA